MGLSQHESRHHKHRTKLLIKSGNVKLKSSPLKPLRELFIEIYPQRLQYIDIENEDAWETILLTNCWTAAASSLQGYAGFELSASRRTYHFVVANYFEVDAWISAINSAKVMSDCRDDDDEDPSSFGGTYAMQPIGQHSWFVKAFTKPTYCNVCRQSLPAFQRSSLCCQICKLKIHKRCAERCQLDCKWTTLQSCGENVANENNEVKMCHQWIEGNLPFGIRCAICTKKCGSLLRLQDFRCLWCRIAVHSSCLTSKSLPSKICTFEQCRLSVLPPSAVRACESLSGGFRAVKPVPSSPLIVFINLKSGSQEGAHFMRRFRQLLNPIQVNSLTLESAAPALQVCANLDSFRVLICGGDGSVGWVLSEIDKLGLVHKCHVGILPLGTGNDLSRVLGWGSTVSLKQDVCDIISNLEQAQIKMLDRWSILTYAFPTPSERGGVEAFTNGIDRSGIGHRSRRSPLAFILRLEDQICSQLEDLSRLCTNFAPVISPQPCATLGPSTITCTTSDASSSTAFCSSARSSNSELFDEMRKRIAILPDLVHSFVSSVMSVGSSQRCSQTLSAELTTGCDAVGGRVRDLIRCWTLIQNRSSTSTVSESGAEATQQATSHQPSQPQLSNPSHPGYQQFLRPPPLSPTPDFDSGCSSDFDVAEDVPMKEEPNMVKFATSTSALVHTLSSSASPPNPVAVLTTIIRHLQIMIPQLSKLLLSRTESHSASSGNFRPRCASAERTLDDQCVRKEVETASTSQKAECRQTLSVTNSLSFMKAQSCGAIARLSGTDSSNNFVDSGCSIGADESCLVVKSLPSPSHDSPYKPPTTTAATPTATTSECERSMSATPARTLFEKKRRSGTRKGGIFPWSTRATVTAASSCTHLAPSSPKLEKKEFSSSSSLKRNERSRSPGTAVGDTGFIRQMLYSSARTLSSVCRQLMIPDPSLIHVTPASAPFEERCVMNNYFGIGLDARIALDFHIRRQEAPESCKSRAKNYAWLGMFGTKQFVQQTYRNLEQRVQLECDGERLLLPSLQGIVILNIPSYMGGVNFWGSTRASHGFAAPSFDDHQLEVVAIFGSAQMAASRVIRLHHHRIAQCRSIRITILDAPLPVQVDGEAWLHPPGVIVIQHKNRAQMLARDLDFAEVLRAWHRASNTEYDDCRIQQRIHSSHRRSDGKSDSPVDDDDTNNNNDRHSAHKFLSSPGSAAAKHRRRIKALEVPLSAVGLSRSSSDINCAYSSNNCTCD